MPAVFVTGVSRGIGFALVELFLRKDYKVVGIGRKSSFKHDNYSFLHCDLGDLDALEELNIELPKEEEIILINNAGVLGEIKHFENQTSSWRNVIDVNLSAVMLLCQQILQQSSKNQKIQIINISSGAGKRPIASWAPYCTSKAGVDLFTQTLQEEMIESERNVELFSLSPGVIDTEMQKQIRSTDTENFSMKQRFVDLKNNDELIQPMTVAESIFTLLNTENQHPVVLRIDEIRS